VLYELECGEGQARCRITNYHLSSTLVERCFMEKGFEARFVALHPDGDESPWRAFMENPPIRCTIARIQPMPSRPSSATCVRLPDHPP